MSLMDRFSCHRDQRSQEKQGVSLTVEMTYQVAGHDSRRLVAELRPLLGRDAMGVEEFAEMRIVVSAEASLESRKDIIFSFQRAAAGLERDRREFSTPIRIHADRKSALRRRRSPCPE